MDKVYMLSFSDYEENFTLGVFSTYEKANQIMDRLVNYPPKIIKNANGEYEHNIDDVKKYGYIGSEFAWWAANHENDYGSRFSIKELKIDCLTDDVKLDNLEFLELKSKERD